MLVAKRIGLLAALFVALAPACSRKRSNDDLRSNVGRAETGPELVFTGMCDASGAVPLSADLFIVADDEDNTLRVYDAVRGGDPVESVELSEQLGLESRKKHGAQHGKKKRKKALRAARFPELDIEAATRVGNRAYWLTSHGRNRSGEVEPARLRFFATTLGSEGDEISVVGQAYAHLLDDMVADPKLAGFQLAAAAELSPKEPQGLSIEGMTERVEGGVWIGFRNPVPAGKALLVPLLNPEQVVEGQRARFGDPKMLDLGGNGVRSLSFWHGQYWVAAGSPEQGDVSQLYAWDGQDKLELRHAFHSGTFNPEGFFSPEERNGFLVLSDDGTVERAGKECKRLKNPDSKQFRGMWLTPAL